MNQGNYCSNDTRDALYSETSLGYIIGAILPLAVAHVSPKMFECPLPLSSTSMDRDVGDILHHFVKVLLYLC